MGTEFLVGRARHELAPAGVAIINENVGSVMILDRSLSGGPVVFINGSDNFLWAQIAKQISTAAARAEPIHVVIKRSLVVERSCLKLGSTLKEFLGDLDDVLSNVKAASATSKSEVIVDATAFRIVTRGKDALVTIMPNGPLDPPLQQAAGKLHSVVSGCAGSVTPQIEQHDF